MPSTRPWTYLLVILCHGRLLGTLPAVVAEDFIPFNPRMRFPNAECRMQGVDRKLRIPPEWFPECRMPNAIPECRMQAQRSRMRNAEVPSPNAGCQPGSRTPNEFVVCNLSECRLQWIWFGEIARCWFVVGLVWRGLFCWPFVCCSGEVGRFA